MLKIYIKIKNAINGKYLNYSDYNIYIYIYHNVSVVSLPGLPYVCIDNFVIIATKMRVLMTGSFVYVYTCLLRRLSNSC